ATASAATTDGEGPKIHVPDPELGQEAEAEPEAVAAENGDEAPKPKKKTRRGSRGGRRRRKSPAKASGSSTSGEERGVERRRREDSEPADGEACAIAGAARGRHRPRGACAEAQHEDEQNPGRREGVRPLHVEVSLVDDPRPGDGGAENERGQRDRQHPAPAQ